MFVCVGVCLNVCLAFWNEILSFFCGEYEPNFRDDLDINVCVCVCVGEKKKRANLIYDYEVKHGYFQM